MLHPSEPLVSLLDTGADWTMPHIGMEERVWFHEMGKVRSHRTPYESGERLREMWALAEPLAMVHQIISYQQIVAGLEPAAKEKFQGGVVEWVRELLQATRDAR